VTSVSGEADTNTVTVDTGSGGGRLRLDLNDDDSIHNGAGHPLGGAGNDNGDFLWGEAYDVKMYQLFMPTVCCGQLYDYLLKK
jgi:hypothetical protein